MELLNKYQDWRRTKNGSIFGLIFGLALAYLSFSWAVESGSILYYIFGFFFVFDAIASGINLTRLNKESKAKVEVKRPPSIEKKVTTKKATVKKTTPKKAATKPVKKSNAKNRKPKKTA